MPSTVGGATDQRLVEGTTYVYHRMQTQILQVTVNLGFSYQCPPGQQNTFFTGAKNFTVTDYEVFSLDK